MQIRLILYFLCSLHVLSAEVPLGEDVKRDLALGFSERALERVSTLLSESSLTTEEEENLLLLQLEALIHTGADITDPLRRLQTTERVEVRVQREYWKGMQEMQEQKFQTAVTTLEPLLKEQEHPYTDSILINLGRLYLQLEDLKKAEEHLSLLRPEENGEHTILTVKTLLRLGKEDRAKTVLDKIPAGKQSVEITLLKSWVRYQNGELEGAIKALENGDYSAETAEGREALSFLGNLYIEAGDGRAHEVIKKVILSSTSEDPLLTYFDQLLLSAPEGGTQELLAYLDELKQKGVSGQAPYILYAQAQLEKEVEEKLELLSTLIKDEKSVPALTEKAAYSFTLLAIQLESEKKKKMWLNEVIKHVPAGAAKAKAYATLAEMSTGLERLRYYEKGLAYADFRQNSVMRLNHNLALSTLRNAPSSDLILATKDHGSLLLEKGLAAQYNEPDKAQQWLEEFLSIKENAERKGEAHLSLAEIMLTKEDESLQKQADAHLKAVRSAYLDALPDKTRFYEAQLKLAILLKQPDVIRKLVTQEGMTTASVLNLGVDLYQEKRYNEAVSLLLQISGRENAKEEKGLAELYIALSHFKLGTSEHHEDAVERLNKLIQSGSAPLKVRARELLAHHYYSLAEVEKALEYHKDLPATPDNMLLKARTLVLSPTPENKKAASKILNDLYKDSSLNASFRYNVAYELALFLEEEKKKVEQLEHYYQVANFEFLPEPTTPADWELYKRLGDKGITLLSTSGNWRTAYKFAQLLGKSRSPHQAYFLEREKEIALENLLWEEE